MQQFSSINWFNVVWELFPYLFVSALLTYLVLKIRAFNQKRQQRRRMELGKSAELEAQKVLKQKGYVIVDYQPKFSYIYQASTEEINVKLTPDFLVKKNNITYAVEVKAGQVNSQLGYKDTRRQLLEYAMATQLPMLYVDMVEQKIYEIEFPFTQKKRGVNWWKWSLISMLILLTAVFMYLVVLGLVR